MSHPAVDWTLEQIKDNVIGYSNQEYGTTGYITDYTLRDGDQVTLKRVDRDTSTILDGNVRKHTDDLQTAAFVGVSYVDRSQQAIGTEYDHQLEEVVSVRIEGLDAAEYGHIDPDGDIGIPFTTLVTRIRNAVLKGRKYPDAGGTNASFTHLLISNEAPQSRNYGDYYRHDFDVVFDGFEELP